MASRADRIGPHTVQLGQTLFRLQGHPDKKAVSDLSNLLPRHHRREDIEAVAQTALATGAHFYPSIKRAVERRRH